VGHHRQPAAEREAVALHRRLGILVRDILARTGADASEIEQLMGRPPMWLRAMLSPEGRHLMTLREAAEIAHALGYRLHIDFLRPLPRKAVN
jgi:hypothetical protein